MSRKKHREKNRNSQPDTAAAFRKQKAAGYARKNLKGGSDNSPLGNSESLKKFSEKEQTDIFADKRNNGPNRSAKYPDSEAVPETSGIRREERIKKAKEMRQSVTEDNTDNPNTEKVNEEKPTSSGSEQAEENVVGEIRNQQIPQTEKATDSVPSEKVQDKEPTSKENISADPHKEKMLKKAAYIKQINEEKVTLSVMAQSEENTANESQNPKVTQSEKTAENVPLEKVQDKIPTSKEDIPSDPQMVKRLKKAAYIKQMNEAKIAGTTGFDENKEQTEEAAEDSSGGTDLPEEKRDINGLDNGKSDTEDIKETYKKGFSAARYKRRKKSRESGSESPVLETAKNASELVSAVQSGNAAKVIALPAKKIAEKHIHENEVIRNAKTVSSAVKNSDSVGGAAAGMGTAAAADKLKRYVQGLFFGSPKDKAKQRTAKKYRYIKKETVSRKNNSERNVKAEHFEKKQLEKKSEAKRNSQRSFFIRENKGLFTNTNVPKKGAEKALKKKLTSNLLLYTVPAVLPIFIILIVLTAASSMFSWLEPITFTPAGSDTEISAEESNEILDAYTLMIQNYLDIAQANYYLEYGDWYGGTYDYPSAEDELSFSEFFSEKCEYILKPIREQFANALANAPNEQARAAISRAMEQAIANALRQAQEGAAEEYQGIIRRLNDSMTAEEKRQHYEVANIGGANGRDDTEEFDGKPIVGTNFFGNVEIESDLSAEELMAMTSLYKTLLLAQSGGVTEDGSDYEYSITPEDIMTFFEDTEYIPINAEITHNIFCAGQNCRRRVVGNYESGYSWEYYCFADHDNLNGSIDPCIGKDELLEKIMELTEAEENGFDKNQCEKILDEYVKNIKKELDIDESDLRQFGSADNERAKDFYETLTDPTANGIPNNIWEVPLPVVKESEESEESEDE